MARKKKEKRTTPKFHEKLDGLDININEFGEVVINKDIEEVTEFLDKEVVDKKLKDRPGFAGYDPNAKKEEEEEWTDPNKEENEEEDEATD